MRLSTGSLAAASVRHPGRTIGAWIIVAALAIAAIVTLLGGEPHHGGFSHEQPRVRAGGRSLEPSGGTTFVRAAESYGGPHARRFRRPLLRALEDVLASGLRYPNAEAERGGGDQP